MKPLILDRPVKYVREEFNQPIIILHSQVELVDCVFKNIRGNKLIAVIVRVDGYTFNAHNFDNVDIGIIADARNVTISHCIFNNWHEDAIRFCKDGAVINGNHIYNYQGSDTHHHDAIQFYSGRQDSSFSHKDIHTPIDIAPKRVLRDCKVISNYIEDSSGYVQGIFSSDGLVCDLCIADNKIVLPNSNHSISVWGMHEGVSVIENNDISQSLTPIRIHKTKKAQDPRATAGNIRVVLRGNTKSKTGRAPHIDGVIEENLVVPNEPDSGPVDEPVNVPPVIDEPVYTPPIDEPVDESEIVDQINLFTVALSTANSLKDIEKCLRIALWVIAVGFLITPAILLFK